MIRRLENLFNARVGTLSCVYQNIVKWLRSNGGDEYVEHEFQNILKEKGIIHEVTIAYYPESNGRAEQLNYTLSDIDRSMLQDAGDACQSL